MTLNRAERELLDVIEAAVVDFQPTYERLWSNVEEDFLTVLNFGKFEVRAGSRNRYKNITVSTGLFSSKSYEFQRSHFFSQKVAEYLVSYIDKQDAVKELRAIDKVAAITEAVKKILAEMEKDRAAQ